MKEVGSFETLMTIQQPTWLNVSEVLHLYHFSSILSA